MFGRGQVDGDSPRQVLPMRLGPTQAARVLLRDHRRASTTVMVFYTATGATPQLVKSQGGACQPLIHPGRHPVAWPTGMAQRVILLPGDGIGPEIIGPAVEVLRAVGTNSSTRSSSLAAPRSTLTAPP